MMTRESQRKESERHQMLQMFDVELIEFLKSSLLVCTVDPSSFLTEDHDCDIASSIPASVQQYN